MSEIDRTCSSCHRAQYRLDQEGWCRRCCQENGWLFLPVEQEATP